MANCPKYLSLPSEVITLNSGLTAAASLTLGSQLAPPDGWMLGLEQVLGQQGFGIFFDCGCLHPRFIRKGISKT